MTGWAGIVSAVGVLIAIVAPASAAPPLIDVPAIAARVLPAVVSITTRHIDREPSQAPVLRRGLGSGVIVDRRGKIVTKHHVIEAAEQIKITLPDERVFIAKLIGTDPVTDVAVIRIAADRLPVARLASSDHVRVGAPVVAIGNPPWIATPSSSPSSSRFVRG